ncbi:MAG TPA: PAS domain S-box protein [Vicinamibacterales bacterium]
MSPNHPAPETFDLQALAQTGEGVFLAHHDRIVDADEGCFVISGYTREELIALPSALAIVAPRERPRIAERLRRRLAGEPLDSQYESWIVHKDGHDVPVEIVVRLANPEEGRLLIFVRDLSRRRETGDFEDLFMRAPVGYHEIDAEGRITRVNDTELRLLGYARHEILGRHVWAIAQDPETVRLSVLRRLRAASAPEPIERAFRRKTGEILWMLVSSVHKRNDEGDVTGMRVILLDITDRKEADARRLQTQKLEAVARLAGGIAHDFNNLLTIVMGYAQSLTEALPPGSDEAQDAREIVGAAERAALLTTQLLAFSRQQSLSSGTIDLNRFIEAAEPLLAGHIKGGVTLRMLPCPSPALVTGDEPLLQQALLNIVLNAREALGGEGVIAVRVLADSPLPPGEKAAGRFHRIDVKDSGPGMSAEVRAHALEPFFSTKEIGQGSGLGLSAAYGLVRQMGGFLAVHSEPGKGSTVSILLPAVDPPKPPPAS